MIIFNRQPVGNPAIVIKNYISFSSKFFYRFTDNLSVEIGRNIMKSGINLRMAKNSWKKDWLSTICFTLFVAISISMISLTTMLFTNLTGAIDNLMETAKTPDYLQMHSGQINVESIDSFAREHTVVTDYQICEFLNVDNSLLSIEGHTLVDSAQDNGFCVQSDKFDFLLGMYNEKPSMDRGQVYVPVCYQDTYNINPGDYLKVGNKKLMIVGFLRDSQMNSMMASSKRFLVGREDYEEIKQFGTEEYLIEFKLQDGADSNSFQAAYEKSRLPMNGPTITGPLIKMMNTLSDGIVILIILFISIIVLIISLVCIRFMLVTKVSNETRDVGLLKAVGFTSKRIKHLIVSRYAVLSILGGILGISLSAIVFDPLSLQMRRLYGVTPNAILNYVFAILSALIVIGIVLLFVGIVLKRIKKMSAVDVLSGRLDKKKKNRGVIIGIVVAIAVFLMVIPTNLHTTLSSPSFVTYMGIGDASHRMDIRGEANSENQLNKIETLLENDESVKEYALYQTSSNHVTLRDGTELNILLEWGNHTKFPVKYVEGKAPNSKGQIALSYLLAEDLQLGIGDTLILETTKGNEVQIVSGIYSDITNGGKTAKINEESGFNPKDSMWRIIYLTLKDGIDEKTFMEKYSNEGVEVIDIASRVKATYGPTLEQVSFADILVKVLACLIILIIIMLFVKMIISNKKREISIKKALGFNNKSIKNRFIKSWCIPIVIGLVLGSVLGCFVGELLCGMTIKSLGAASFCFEYNVISIVINVVVGGVVSVAAVTLGCMGIKKIEPVESCRGRD